MRHQYAIDPEIQALLPPLSPEESGTLRTMLVGERHCDDLTVLRIESEQKNVLGDGHNRDVICREEGVSFNTRLVKVADRAAALQWVINNQLGRRNLTDERRDYYIGKEYLNGKQPHGGPREKQEPIIGSCSSTAEKIAKEHDVAASTVKENAAFAAAVDALPPEMKEAILNGTLKVTKKTVIGGKMTLCERCKRVGIVKDCPQCAEARKKKGVDGHGRKKTKGKKKVTAKAVIKDAIGTLVPDHLRDAFADTQLAEMIATLEGLQSQFKPEPWTEKAGKLCEHFGFILIDKFRTHIFDSVARLQLAIEALTAGLPHAVCPKCNGIDSKKDGKCCRGCRGFGVVPEHRYQELIGA